MSVSQRRNWSVRDVAAPYFLFLLLALWTFALVSLTQCFPSMLSSSRQSKYLYKRQYWRIYFLYKTFFKKMYFACSFVIQFSTDFIWVTLAYGLWLWLMAFWYMVWGHTDFKCTIQQNVTCPLYCLPKQSLFSSHFCPLCPPLPILTPISLWEDWLKAIDFVVVFSIFNFPYIVTTISCKE